MTGSTVPAVERSIDLRCSADHAFTVFTDRIATWWPLDKHSIAAFLDGRTAVDCVIENRVGGRVYEVLDGGSQLDWGRVAQWEPGRLLELDWNPSLEARPPTRLEVRFTPTGDHTCRVEVVHDGWEVMPDAAAVRESYSSGWVHTLELLAAAAEQ